jgi:hypothetical protein
MNTKQIALKQQINLKKETFVKGLHADFINKNKINKDEKNGKLIYSVALLASIETPALVRRLFNFQQAVKKIMGPDHFYTPVAKLHTTIALPIGDIDQNSLSKHDIMKQFKTIHDLSALQVHSRRHELEPLEISVKNGLFLGNAITAATYHGGVLDSLYQAITSSLVKQNPVWQPARAPLGHITLVNFLNAYDDIPDELQTLLERNINTDFGQFSLNRLSTHLITKCPVTTKIELPLL